MMPLCPGSRAPYISYSRGCAKFRALGAGLEAEKHPLPVSASLGEKRRRGSLKAVPGSEHSEHVAESPAGGRFAVGRGLQKDGGEFTRANLNRHASRVTQALPTGLSGTSAPLVVLAVSRFLIVNRGGALERHLLQSGAARHSRENNNRRLG